MEETMPVETGLRERKKAATRDALRRAALDLTSERGLDGFTVDDVCARVGVSQRTFFNYFPTKEAALLVWDDEARAAARDAVLGRPADEDPATALGEVLADVIGLTGDGAVWQRHVRLMRAHPELVARSTLLGREMERTLAAALAHRAGTAPDDLEPTLVAATVLVAFRVAMQRWLAAPEGTDARAVLTETLRAQRLTLAR